MTVTAPIFRQVCQFTGDIAEPPEEMSATSAAAPQCPAADRSASATPDADADHPSTK